MPDTIAKVCFCGSTDYKKFGFTRNGLQRWSCCGCGCTRVFGTKTPRKAAQKEAARLGFLSGKSVREVMLATKLAKNTVCGIRKELLPELQGLTCECGDDIGHRGWCSVRYANSPSRQAFMATIIPKSAPCFSLRPGAFFLGFLSRVSLHISEVPRQRRCESRSCPFPAMHFDAEGSHLCSYHVRFFNYSESMTDTRLGWEDLHDSEDEEAPLSVVKPWDNTLVWEHRGQRQYEATTEHC